MRDRLEISNILDTIAEDHIRQAIMHLECYLASWFDEKEFIELDKWLSPIIKRLKEKIS